MLDLKFILSNLEQVKENCKNRNIRIDLDALIKMDEKRRVLIGEVEDLRRQQNENASAMKAKLPDNERQKLIEKGRELKTKENDKNSLLTQISADVESLLRQIPNMTHPKAPIAATEDGNKEIRRFGEPTKFNFSEWHLKMKVVDLS